jgi:hypothetical protein
MINKTRVVFHKSLKIEHNFLLSIPAEQHFETLNILVMGLRRNSSLSKKVNPSDSRGLGENKENEK